MSSSNYELPTSLARLQGTVGVWASPDLLPAVSASDMASHAERAGFSVLWIPEAWGRESFVNAGLQLQGSTSLTIATGITNIWGRDAVASAAVSRTLNAAYGDRFVLGLGVSHQPLVERLRGHTYAGPVAAMRAYLEAMDAAPNFSHEGSHRFARVIAALGPRMLDLAAELTDGVHPYLVTPEHTAVARAAVGAAKFIGVEQAVVFGASREEFLRRAHAHLDIYTGLENYRNSWRRLGFDDDDFVRGGSDRLCDAMVVHGTEEAIIARVKEHREAGADHVCLQFLNETMGVDNYDEWQRVGNALGA